MAIVPAELDVYLHADGVATMRLVYQDKAHRLHVTFNELERRLATYELDVDPH